MKTNSEKIEEWLRDVFAFADRYPDDESAICLRSLAGEIADLPDGERMARGKDLFDEFQYLITEIVVTHSTHSGATLRAIVEEVFAGSVRTYEAPAAAKKSAVTAAQMMATGPGREPQGTLL